MNCEGNTYNISMGCCQPVLAPIENYYTKWQIDKMLSGETSGCCITPEEVDEKIESAKTEIEGEIPSLDGYATEEYVTQSISGKADSDDLATVSGDVQSLSAEVQSIVVSGVSGISSAECQSMIDATVNQLSAITTAHTANTIVHITNDERTSWNNKASVSAMSESDWATHSGSSISGVIYLIY